jgi:hypothetical protein
MVWGLGRRFLANAGLFLFRCAAEKTIAHARYLFSRALRSFIFHANQWLAHKAARQAPAKLAYPPRRLARGNIFLQPGPAPDDLFRAPFRALFALDGLARNQAVRRSTGSCAFASGRGIMSLYKLDVNGACGFILVAWTTDTLSRFST